MNRAVIFLEFEMGSPLEVLSRVTRMESECVAREPLVLHRYKALAMIMSSVISEFQRSSAIVVVKIGVLGPPASVVPTPLSKVVIGIFIIP